MRFITVFLLIALGLSLDCSDGQIHLDLVRTYSSYAGEEKAVIYYGTDTSETATPVITIQGISSYSNTVQTYEACTTAGIHTVVMTDSWGDGWSAGSNLVISSNDEELGTVTLGSGSSSTATVNIVIVVNSWKYSNEAQTTDNWKTAELTWSDLTVFPAVTTVTRYFRKTMTVPEDTFGIYFEITTDVGFVAYLNGKKIYDWAMPTTGTVTSSTLATSSVTTAVPRMYSTLTGLYGTLGTNAEIAIEVHAATSSPSGAETFVGKVELLSGTQSRRNKYSRGSCESVTYTVSGSEHVANLYDDNTSTKWCIVSPTFPVWTYFLWNNEGRELINRYQVASANDMQVRDPKDWKIYASNDPTNDNSWVLLDEQTSQVFSSRKLVKTYDIDNLVPYNAYKIEISAQYGSNTYFQFSEFSLLMHPVEISTPTLEYPEDTYTFAANVDTVSISPVQAGFSTFTITPALPTGLSFSASTGSISGIPTTASSATTYTVSAMYNDESYTTTISITVTACQLPDNVYVVVQKSNAVASETYQIRNSNNEIVFSSLSTTNGICLAVGDYTVSMTSSTGAAWAADSYLTLKSDINDEQVVLEKARLNKAGSDSFVFTLKYPIAPAAYNSNIKYYLADTTIPANWYSTTPSDWTTLNDASRISTTTKTQLFFQSFNVDSKTGINAFELRVKAKSGIVVYVNGVELYRRYLADGDITTSTTASGGQNTAYWHSIVGCSSILNQGANTIAVGIVNLGDTATTMAFDMTLRLITSTVLTPRNWDITTSAANLFDNNPTTVATLTRTAGEEQTVTMNFNNDAAVVVNNYCMTSSSETYNNDPMNWTVSGSKDGTTYTEIKSESNYYFEARSTSYCFFMSTNNVAYSYYKFTLKDTRGESATQFNIADIDLLVEDLTAVNVPDLSFSPAVMVGYTDASFPEITSSSDYYSSFTISPALPTGLSIVSSTGVIRGSLSQPFAASIFTVSAINHLGETKTTTISVAVEMCANDKVSFTLEVDLKTGATGCSFDLIDLATRQVVISRSNFYDNTPFTIPMCEAATTYTLVLKKTNTAGWGENKVNVKLADGTLLLSEALAAGVTEREYNFNPAYVIAPEWTEWSYLVDGSAAPSGWNTVENAPASWSAARAGSYPVAGGVTQYYYKKFSVESLDSFSVLDISVNVKAGAIIYLNGKEIRRINMPTGDVTSSTVATKENAEPIRIITGEWIQDEIVKAGENIVAIELHRYQENEASNSFDASAIFILDNMYMILEGVASSTPSGSGSTTADKAFDNNALTKAVLPGQCVGASIEWAYDNDRREPIARYGVVSGSDCNVNTPSGWKVEGSNDGETWTVLHAAENQIFSTSNADKRSDFYNNVAYNKYRLTSTECKNSNLASSEVCDAGFQVAEFYLFSRRVENYCPADGDYPAAIKGDYSYINCPALYSGLRRRYCAEDTLGDVIDECVPDAPAGITYESNAFTFYQKKTITPVVPTIVAAEYTVSIFPSLPDGLSLDASTGTISGTPTTLTEKRAHTVMVTNKTGKTTALISVEVVEAPTNWVLIGILIAVVVIIIVVVVVVVVMSINKKKDQKSKPASKKVSKNMKTTKAPATAGKAVKV